MTPITAYKMSGTGNDFVIIDLRDEATKQAFDKLYPNRPQASQHFCNRETEYKGADGLVLLESSSEHEFQWDFYNSDGSEAEMCGNAARCAALFNFDKGLQKAQFFFETTAGVLEAKIESPQSIHVSMTEIINPLTDQEIETPLGNIKYDFINSGVPHAILETDKILDQTSLKPIALELRKPNYFKPKGANITFLENIDSETIQSVSFERGVEGFTLACGTGAVAAAKSHSLKYGKTKIEVQVPGGILHIDFSGTRPQLIGPAEYISHFKVGGNNV